MAGRLRNGDISTHYSAAEFRELIEAVQRIDAGRETSMITVLRPVECLANVLLNRDRGRS